MNSTEKMKQIFVWIFIVGLSIIFVVAFTLPGGSIGHRSVVIGEVSGKSITTGRRSKFVRYYKQTIDSWQQQGIKIDDYHEVLAKQQAFRAVAEQIIIRDFSVKNNYSISDQELVGAIKQSQFVDEEGTFRSQVYEDFKKRGSSVDKIGIEEEVRDRLLVQRLMYTLFNFVPVSVFEVEQKIKASEFKKSFVVGYLDLEERLEEVIDPLEILSYYSNHTTKYEGKNFEDVEAVVESDYINENTTELMQKLKVKYHTFLSSKQSMLRDDFTSVLDSMKMRVFKTAEVSYFDTEVMDLSFEKIEEISIEDFIKKVMLLPKGDISVPIDIGSAIVVVQVYSVNTPKSTLPVSSFALEKFKEDIQKEKMEFLQYSFRDNLYKTADIESEI